LLFHRGGKCATRPLWEFGMENTELWVANLIRKMEKNKIAKVSR
jgi:hypothetical protein